MLYLRLLFPQAERPVHGRVTHERPDEVELLDGDLFGALRPSGQRLALTPETWDAWQGGDPAAPRLLAPLAPGKIIGVGSNYVEHTREMGKPLPEEPVLFFKPTTAILDPGGAIAANRSGIFVDPESVDNAIGGPDAADRNVISGNQVGIYVNGARTRIEGEMRSLKGSLLELTENVIRLRRQLREIEIQAESQMQSRTAQAADEHHAGFDPLEFDLLVALARKPRQVFTREVLLEQVWGYRHPADTRLVNVHVQRLRAKVEKDPENPQVVLTVRGVGYKAGPP